MRAILKEPTGWRNPASRDSDVTILGFVWGAHRDGAGYDRRADTVLAVVALESGELRDVPIRWVKYEAPHPTETEGRV